MCLITKRLRNLGRVRCPLSAMPTTVLVQKAFENLGYVHCPLSAAPARVLLSVRYL